ncbi:MAG: flagellar hook-associated protein FlgK [Pseudomonadota bacterium]
MAMSLDTANNIARQALIASQFQINLSARNVAAAGDENRSRVSPELATTINGGVETVGVRRTENAAVFTRLINATATTAERDAVLRHLNSISQTVGDPEVETSIAARIGELQNAVADYANAPDDPLFGRTVVERGRDVANELNRITSEMLVIREETDREMFEAVEDINRQLDLFHNANTAIVSGTLRGGDVTMDLDRRDAAVKAISEHLGVTVLRRENNDMALFTDAGVTLYDKQARSVTFDRTAIYTPGAVGGEVRVDGLAVTGPNTPMASTTGSIVGNAYVRDTIAATYQLQMDEIARELTDIFDDPPGSLFTSTPPNSAGTIAINAAVDPAQGGTVEALRDGSGNAGGNAFFADRMLTVSAALDTPTTFDPATELPDNASLMTFATQSAGWLEGQRLTVEDQVLTESAILRTASDSLSRITGVNLDDEYAQQLAIERSFSASSRLIGVIDELFVELLRIV